MEEEMFFLICDFCFWIWFHIYLFFSPELFFFRLKEKLRILENGSP